MDIKDPAINKNLLVDIIERARSARAAELWDEVRKLVGPDAHD